MIEYEDAERTIAGYAPQQETTETQQGVSFRFSLQILAQKGEGLSLKGDASMQKNATMPTQKIQRASRPIQQSTTDVEEYDDDSVGKMPRSAVRYRTTQPQKVQSERTTQALPSTTHRVSGSTRLGLYGVLLFCVLFLLNGLIWPMFSGVLEQFKYGDARIATYDIASKHWITEEENGRVRIVVSNEDGTHNQVLTTMISNAPKHALVSLSVDGAKIDVSINGAFVTTLVSDGNNGYKWSTN